MEIRDKEKFDNADKVCEWCNLNDYQVTNFNNGSTCGDLISKWNKTDVKGSWFRNQDYSFTVFIY